MLKPKKSLCITVATTKLTIPKLHSRHYLFPDPLKASKEGLLAWGGDLNPLRLLEAYRQGIFPWFNEGDPILWWSPNPRALLYPDDMRVSKSLRKSMKHFEIRYDTAFERVMRLCQETRVHQGKSSWISKPLIKAFCVLHEMGFAHSVECYRNDVLVGGLYGLYIGGVFCGESMFSTCTDASKAALFGLCQKVKAIEGDFIDCQLPTAHLSSLGAVEVQRDLFLNALEKSLTCKERKPWLSK